MSEKILVEAINSFTTQLKEHQKCLEVNSASLKRSMDIRKERYREYIDSIDKTIDIENTKVCINKREIERLQKLIADTSLILKPIQDKKLDEKKKKEQMEQAERQKIINERIKTYMEGKEYVDFRYKNCDDECKGWDGYNGRCDCRNRRVYWEEDNIYEHNEFCAYAD